MKQKLKIGIVLGTILIVAVVIGLTFPYTTTANEPSDEDDLSPKFNPQILGTIPGIGTVKDLKISPDGKVYFASTMLNNSISGLNIMDISDPTNPKIVNSQRPLGIANDIAFHKDLILTTDVVNKCLNFFYINNPGEPRLLSSKCSVDAKEVKVIDNYAYILHERSISVWDISDPLQIQRLNTLSLGTYIDQMVTDGEKLVLRDKVNTLLTIDISDPAQPSLATSISLGSISGISPAALSIQGNLVLVAIKQLGSFQVIDLTDIYAPAIVGTLESSIYKANDMAIYGTIAYIADGPYLKMIDFSNPTQPTLLSSYTSPSYSKDILDIYHNTENDNITAVIYSFSTSSPKIHIVDITDPLMPQDIGIIEPTSSNTLDVFGNTAITCTSQTFTDKYINTIDISNPEYPQILAELPLSGKCTDVDIIDDNYAYIVVYGKITIINIEDLSNPVIITTLDTPSDITEISISKQTQKAVAITYSYSLKSSTLEVFDISDPSSPILNASLSFQGSTKNEELKKIILKDNLVILANNGDQYIADKYVYLIDISVSTNPNILGKTQHIEYGIWDIGQKDNFLYVTDGYQNIYVFDIINPAVPQNIGFGNGVVGHTVKPGNNGVIYSLDTYNGIINVADVSDPSNITKMSSFSTNFGNKILFFQNKLFVTGKYQKLGIYDAYGDSPYFGKTVDKTEVSVGDEISYSLTISNTSLNTLTNLIINEPIPTNTTYVSGSASGNGNYNGSSIIWTIPEMAPDQTITETFKVSIN